MSVGVGLIRKNPSADKSGVLQGHSLSPYPVVCRELPRTGVDRRMGTPGAEQRWLPGAYRVV